MCGFCGFLEQRQEANSRELLSSMLDTLSHRGPDKEDSYLDTQISLGFKRLKIIDLETGKQPMSNENKNSGWCVMGKFIIIKNCAKNYWRRDTAFGHKAMPR